MPLCAFTSSRSRWHFRSNHHFRFYCPISFTFICKVAFCSSRPTDGLKCKLGDTYVKTLWLLVPHSKPKTGFKNSKWRQWADITTRNVILSHDSGEDVVFNGLKYWVLHSRMEFYLLFLLFIATFDLLHISNRQGYSGELEV